MATAFGPGTVAFVRMAPPTYATVEAVSVVLDKHRTRPGYAGTMMSVGDATPVDADAGMLTPDPPGVCEHGYAQGCRGCDPDGR